MKRIALTCKDPGKWFHDCVDCNHYEKCDYFQKPKQSPSSNDGLGTKRNSDMIIDSARIIVFSTNPVKLIASQIRYHRLVEKMYRQNVRIK